MFTVAFQDRDPFIANQVTRDLVTGYADESLRAFDRLLSTGIPPALARRPTLTLEFFYPAKRSPYEMDHGSRTSVGRRFATGSPLGTLAQEIYFSRGLTLVKRILHQLVRLYPRFWRQRYEAEFRSVLDASEPQWKAAFDLAKGGIFMQFRTGLALNTLAFGIGAALLAAAALRITPATYESYAVISMRALNPRTGGTATAQINTIAQRVLSHESVDQVMQTFHLYEQDCAQGRTEEAVEKVRKSIRISNLLEQPALNFVSVSFRDPNPLIARQVTQDLVSRFIDGNVRAAGEAFMRTAEPRSERILSLMEMVSPATEARHPSGPNEALVIGVALAEGSQLGLIFALFRRRAVTYT